MTVETLTASVTGCSNIRSVEVRDGFSQPSAVATVECATHSLNIGDQVAISMGHTSLNGPMMPVGFVKNISARRPDQIYTITIHDILSQAQDYFLASDDPETPYEASVITAEALVGELLGFAGITSYLYDASGFTFGVLQDGVTPNPVPINLVSAWDYIENINRITGFATFYNPSSGSVEFRNRKPYIVGGDTASYVFTSGSSTLGGDYSRSDDRLRNRVVVYGSPGINAISSGSSPYLPANFYKTIVISHQLINNQTLADNTAALNLTMFNRLTETLQFSTVGRYNIRARSIVAVVDSFWGLDASTLWIVHSSAHRLTLGGGYTMDLTLVR